MNNNKKLIVVMSHSISEDQVTDAKLELGVDTVEQMTGDVADACKAIDPNASFQQIRGLAADVVGTAFGMDATHISVMGEPALVTAAYEFAQHNGMTFIQSTSERVSQDIPQEDGTIKKISMFKHVQWRIWE